MTDVDDFYALIDRLRRNCGGERRLIDCDARTGWPERGVYFFFEPGETRANGEPRIVRIGTHALRNGSSTTLWKRLSQHRGNVGGSNPGGGNHRGSIFRLHVGQCLLARDGDPYGIANTWGVKPSASRQVRERERVHETMVSEYIRRMPFVWLPVLDNAGPTSDRARIESQSIALLSYARRNGADPPSSSWLGHHSTRTAIRDGGLWNVDHVGRSVVGDLFSAMEHQLLLRRRASP